MSNVQVSFAVHPDNIELTKGTIEKVRQIVNKEAVASLDNKAMFHLKNLEWGYIVEITFSRNCCHQVFHGIEALVKAATNTAYDKASPYQHKYSGSPFGKIVNEGVFWHPEMPEIKWYDSAASWLFTQMQMFPMLAIHMFSSLLINGVTFKATEGGEIEPIHWNHGDLISSSMMDALMYRINQSDKAPLILTHLKAMEAGYMVFQTALNSPPPVSVPVPQSHIVASFAPEKQLAKEHMEACSPKEAD